MRYRMGNGRIIAADPGRNFGRPFDEETGVPTTSLAGVFLGGDCISAAAGWYDVPAEAVEAAIQFEMQTGRGRKKFEIKEKFEINPEIKEEALPVSSSTNSPHQKVNIPG